MSRIITDVVGDMKATATENSDGSFTIKHSQDVSSILDANKAQYTEAMVSRHKFSGDMNKVASIPMITVLEWMNEGVNVMSPTEEDIIKIRAKLNSPENMYLRTRPGRI